MDEYRIPSVIFSDIRDALKVPSNEVALRDENDNLVGIIMTPESYQLLQSLKHGVISIERLRIIEHKHNAFQSNSNVSSMSYDELFAADIKTKKTLEAI